MTSGPLPRLRQYNEALLFETHEALRVSFARFGIDGEKPHGKRLIPGDELGGAGFPAGAFGLSDPASGVFPVVKLDDSAIAENRYGAEGPAITVDSSTTPALTDLPASSGPSAVPSSVHTLDTTRQLHAGSGETSQNRIARLDWSAVRENALRERVAATTAFRMRVASDLRARARFRRRKARVHGFTEKEIAKAKGLQGLAPLKPLSERQIRERRIGQWHRSRAKNEERVESVALGCGKEKTMVVSCEVPGCGCYRELPMRCRRRFWCFGCRKQGVKERSAKVFRALESLIDEGRRRGLRGRFRRREEGGGRWAVKFLTLTAPHVDRMTLEDRIDCECRAVVLFERRLRRHIKALDDRNVDLLHWYRSLEWTHCKSDGLRMGRSGKRFGKCTPTGACLKGHPHAHALIFAPFLDQAMLADWWADALRAVGYTDDERKDYDNVWIEDAENSKRYGSLRGAVAELAKYVCKDVDAKGDMLEPATFADVYAGLSRRRLSQCSRGFMKRANIAKRCPECKQAGWFRTRIVDGVRPEEKGPGICGARPPAERQQLVTAG